MLTTKLNCQLTFTHTRTGVTPHLAALLPISRKKMHGKLFRMRIQKTIKINLQHSAICNLFLTLKYALLPCSNCNISTISQWYIISASF